LRAVLAANADLVAIVTPENISAGPRPVGMPMPSVMVSRVSANDRNIPSPGSTRHVRERVQVTGLARNYTEQKAILRAVRHAAADRLGIEVPGIANVTIHTESAGPDFMSEDTSIWIGVQDFIVTYTETR
jgi:cytochrome oxidase assembly protein ShyY1